jgi:threonine dehydrogenase-like Zn-dependent dehydrogenase
MRGVVVRGEREVVVEDVADAELQASGDALLRLTSTAMCGSDLHIYEGRMGDVDGMLIGHEPLGVVEEVGPDVVSVRPATGSSCRRASAVASAPSAWPDGRLSA